MIKNITLILCLTLLAACSSNEEKSSQVSSTTPATTPQTNPVAPTEEVLYPSITNEEMQNLWNNTTSIDYLFYELPMSMNMTEKTAIQSTLKQISNVAPPIKKDCKAMGRVFFQENGNGLAEADFFFAPGCTYFVFMENQKPVKANQMTKEGIKFFQNLLASASQKQ